MPTRRVKSAQRKPTTGRRLADAPLVLLPLDAVGGRSLQRQIYDGLRDAILSQRFRPGARLPSTRALATELGVSRNTVTVAFEQLRSEGYIAGKRGGGTRVRDALPDAILAVSHAPDRAHKSNSARRNATARDSTVRDSNVRSSNVRSSNVSDSDRGDSSLRVSASRGANIQNAVPPRLSSRGAYLAAQGAALIGPSGTPPAAFRLGVPANDVFPDRIWARLTARQWRARTVHRIDAHPAGELVLRDAIASYLVHARGARCTSEQVIVVSGTQQALDVAARVLLDVGDAVWLEDPGYGGAQAVFAASGARVIPVPVDADGLDVLAAEQREPNARLAYVTPSHQFPLGCVMSAPRRLALLAWAQRACTWILEDDYDSEFRYAGRPLPCLQGLESGQLHNDQSARVLYVGTFNKSLVPGIRIGYLVVPDALIDPMLAARVAMDRHPPTFEQGILSAFIGEGHYARHLRRLRAIYSDRQRVLLDAARSELEGMLELTPDVAGLHLIGTLRNGMSDIDATARAARLGVETTPLSRFTLDPVAHPIPQALLLSYAGFDETAIRRAVRLLRDALARH